MTAKYVHDDLKLAQFLLGNDGRIKLNDFSRTRELVWDSEENAYEKWKNGGRHGDVSPTTFSRLSFYRLRFLTDNLPSAAHQKSMLTGG